MQRRAFVAAPFAGALFAADAPRVGVIGAGGRGRYLIDQFKEIGAPVVAVCDVYEPNLKRGVAAASTGAAGVADYRKLLDDASIQAVVIATPDHWHARMAIDAVDAGKDVYLEKPLAHTIDEGFALIDAVRHTGRILQVGMQRRSADLFQKARQLAAPSELGEVRLVTSVWLNRQSGLSRQSLEGPLDWKQWLGSAPARQVDPLRFFNWYYFWDYSGGLLVGQAAHIVDAIQWFMGSREPVAVTCAGGRVNLDGAEVPETASMSSSIRRTTSRHSRSATRPCTTTRSTISSFSFTGRKRGSTGPRELFGDPRIRRGGSETGRRSEGAWQLRPGHPGAHPEFP